MRWTEPFISAANVHDDLLATPLVLNAPNLEQGARALLTFLLWYHGRPSRSSTNVDSPDLAAVLNEMCEDQVDISGGRDYDGNPSLAALLGSLFLVKMYVHQPLPFLVHPLIQYMLLVVTRRLEMVPFVEWFALHFRSLLQTPSFGPNEATMSFPRYLLPSILCLTACVTFK